MEVSQTLILAQIRKALQEKELPLRIFEGQRAGLMSN